MSVAVQPADDADDRAAVWKALANLYLDTDVESFLPHIADTLAASPYSLEALYEILIREVHPALYVNLLVVAGEWAGFDEDWLIARIAEVRRQPLWRRKPTLWFYGGETRSQWRRLAPMIAAARAQAGERSLDRTTAQA